MRIEDIPSEVTMTLIPQAHAKYGWVSVFESLVDDYVQIADPIEVTFATKTEGVREQVIENLREKASKIRAESERECMQIEEQIQSLLALPSGEAA